MMRRFRVGLCFPDYCGTELDVEAETPEKACEAAMQMLVEDSSVYDFFKRIDAGETFVDFVDEEDPDGVETHETPVEVPEKYKEFSLHNVPTARLQAELKRRGY